MVIFAHVGLLSIVTLIVSAFTKPFTKKSGNCAQFHIFVCSTHMAISESAGDPTILDEIKLTVNDDNRFLVREKPPPNSFTGLDVIVRRSIILDHIKTKDKPICLKIERFLEKCRFPERVVNKDATMNEEMGVEVP